MLEYPEVPDQLKQTREGQTDENICHVGPWRTWLRCVTPAGCTLAAWNLSPGSGSTRRPRGAQEDHAQTGASCPFQVPLPAQGSRQRGPADVPESPWCLSTGREAMVRSVASVFLPTPPVLCSLHASAQHIIPWWVSLCKGGPLSGP